MNHILGSESSTSPVNSRTMNTEGSTGYQYTRLSTTTRQIRLLKIQQPPNEGLHTTMHFSLEVFDFAIAPPYRTLSYMWGTESLSKEIQVNNHSFAVRPNLFELLKLYHSRDIDGYLWIDFICIDQDLVAERNAQVAMMGDIYEKGMELIIWLGIDSSEQKERSRWIQGFFTHLRELLASEETDGLPDVPCYSNNPQLSLQRASTDQASKLPTLSDEERILDHSVVQSQAPRLWKYSSSDLQRVFMDDIAVLTERLKEFTGNQYWTRAWIIQEVLLSSARTVWHDEVVVEWILFDILCRVLGATVHLRPATLMRPQLVSLRGHCASREAFNPMEQYSLAVSYGGSDSFDPRDLIYSWQGLLEVRFRCCPDYEAAPEVVFYAMIERWICEGGELRLGIWWSCKTIALKMGLKARRVLLTEQESNSHSVLRAVVGEESPEPIKSKYRSAWDWHHEILSNEMWKAERMFEKLRSHGDPKLHGQVLLEAFKAILLGIAPHDYGNYIGRTALITEEA